MYWPGPFTCNNILHLTRLEIKAINVIMYLVQYFCYINTYINVTLQVEHRDCACSLAQYCSQFFLQPQIVLKLFRSDFYTPNMVISSVIIVPKLLVQDTIADCELHVPIHVKIMRHSDTKTKFVSFSV